MEAEPGSHFFDGHIVIISMIDQIVMSDQIFLTMMIIIILIRSPS